MIKFKNLFLMFLSIFLLAGCVFGKDAATDTDSVEMTDTEYIFSESQAAEQIPETEDPEITLAGQEETMSEYDFEALSNVTITGADWETFHDEELDVLYQFARYSQAMTEPDIDVLSEIIADDTTFTHMSGKTQTKSEYLADIENGSLDYISIEIQNPTVTMDNGIAALSCTHVLTANAYGARGSWPFDTIRYFELHDGVWQLINRP